MTQEIPPAGAAESARVIATVSSIPLAVDLGHYDLAEMAFAPSVTIDYTSLWGGEPQTMNATALMDAWRALVPGFDATRHELRDVTATVTEDRAIATAHVDARHWLRGELWRLIGQYEWSLQRQSDGWKVTQMILVLTEELGNRDLASRAAARAISR